jgi:hypothetical protein
MPALVEIHIVQVPGVIGTGLPSKILKAELKSIMKEFLS